MRTRDGLEVRPQGRRHRGRERPPKPEGILADARAKIWVAPGHKMFFPASALLLVFMGLFLNFQVFVPYWNWNLERNRWWNERFRGWFHFRAGSC